MKIIRKHKQLTIETLEEKVKRLEEEKKELIMWLRRIYYDDQNKACSVRVEELIKKTREMQTF